MITQFAEYYHRPITYGAGGGWVEVFVMILFFGLIIGALVVVYRMVAHSNSAIAQRDPLDIAKERFAKGEITKEEFADIRKELKD